jgi:AbrB family looped-hinge helix DNA binding protein
MNPETTKMSSRGQIVIPERIRRQLHLEPGAEFVVVAKADVLVFKQLSAPRWKQFNDLIRDARRQARAAGLTPRHVKQAIAKVRSGR